MAYSKGDFAEALGVTRGELEDMAKEAGFDTTEAYYNFIGGPTGVIKQEIIDQIVELDRELATLGSVGLTQAEKDAFLQKAIDRVSGYYDNKVAEIEAGVREGKLRTAEDVLMYTREVGNEVRETLEFLDLKTAQTEEEFLNKLADITSTKDENIETKREEWRLKLESTRFDQIQAGILTSGIGGKKREDIKRLEEMEVGQVEARAQRAQLEEETKRKYTLEQVRLAREAAERDRAARIGAPATEEALDITGYENLGEFPAKTEIEMARARDERNVPIYQPSAFAENEEQRRIAVESRKQELQEEELAIRKQKRESQRQEILARKATAQSRLASYG